MLLFGIVIFEDDDLYCYLMKFVDIEDVIVELFVVVGFIVIVFIMV